MAFERWIAGAGIALAVFAGGASALGQDPLKLLPQNYKLIFENDEIMVIRAHYGPHEKIPVHDHTSFAAVFVYLSNSGQVQLNHEEAGEKPVPVLRPPTFKGSYRVAEGAAERHSVENLGDTSSDFLRVELKEAPLKLKEPFRGKAPQDLTHNLDVIEFENPAVEVERIVCVGASACAVSPSLGGSLLIAFNATMVRDGAGKEHAMSAGTVEWLPASRGFAVKQGSQEPAHLLRILLPHKPV